MTLLDLDFGTSLFEGFLQALCLFLRDAFLNGLGGVVNQLLGLFQTEGGHILDSLHNTKFLGLIGNTLQDHVEGGLLLGGGGASGGGASGNCDGSGGGFNAVLLFQDVSEFSSKVFSTPVMVLPAD